MKTHGNLTVTETGDTEFAIPFCPGMVEVMFVDGLSDQSHCSCSHQQPDQVFGSIRRIKHHHREKYYLHIQWVVSKPRKIWWKISR